MRFWRVRHASGVWAFELNALRPLTCAALVVDYRSLETSEPLVRQLDKVAQAASDSLRVIWIQQGQSGAQVPSGLSTAVQTLAWEENLGYAGAIQKAIGLLPTRPDLYWLINADVRVAAETFSGLREMFVRHPRAGAVGPRMLTGQKLWGARGVVDVILGRTAMVDWPKSKRSQPLPFWSYVPGACIMVRADAYHQVGGLPEIYFLYYEETELCVRLQQQGWELYCASDLEIQHAVVSREHRIPAPHYAYYFVRNNLLFWRRCFGISKRSQWLRLFVFVFLKEIVLPLRRSPSWAVFKDRMGWALRGLRESTKL